MNPQGGACGIKRDAKADVRLEMLLGTFCEPGARRGEIEYRILED